MSVKLEIIETSHLKYAHAQLNAEASLNALNLEMIKSLYEALKKWESDPSIQFALLDAAGEKAFCAGGDIVQLYNSIKEKGNYYLEFFENEYRLDYLIHKYSKPIIGWGHGIVMGGGMGILQGCSHRVVTEKTMMAMPEISIGLFPDVGASYFLQQCPRGAGNFLALSGTRINASEARELKLADYCVLQSYKAEVLKALSTISINQSHSIKDKVTQILSEYQEASQNQMPKTQLEWSWIETLTSKKTPLELVKFCESQAAPSPWAERGRQNILKASPTSVAIIFEQFKKASTKKLNEVFQMEWLIAVNCSRSNDFPEGVRALLIDKDNKPQWSPTHVKDIEASKIESYFKLSAGLSQNPLNNLN